MFSGDRGNCVHAHTHTILEGLVSSSRTSCSKLTYKNKNKHRSNQTNRPILLTHTHTHKQYHLCSMLGKHSKLRWIAKRWGKGGREGMGKSERVSEKEKDNVTIPSLTLKVCVLVLLTCVGIIKGAHMATRRRLARTMNIERVCASILSPRLCCAHKPRCHWMSNSAHYVVMQFTN